MPSMHSMLPVMFTVAYVYFNALFRSAVTTFSALMDRLVLWTSQPRN